MASSNGTSNGTPNGTGRPTGSVSIPVEIIRDSNSTNARPNSRQSSPFRPLFNDNQFPGFSDSPSRSFNSNNRFQPRHSPNTAYDRVINNSQFNQPINDRYSQQQQYQEPQYQEPQYRYSQQMYEPGPSLLSRSSDDILSSPFESMQFNDMPQYTSLIPPSFGSGFRNDSDFVQPTTFPSPLLRRSFDALNDFPDMRQSFPTFRQYPSEQSQQRPQPPPSQQQQQQQPPPPPPPQQQQQQQQQQQPYYRTSYQTQHQPQPQQQPTYANQAYINPNIVYTNEYGVPTDHYQQNTYQGAGNTGASDLSRSPASQRGASPARPPPSTSQQQQQQDEPELKMAKDADGPIPMPPPASSSSSNASPSTHPTESQAPPADTKPKAKTPTPPPETVRDPNAIALEKLEQIKQNLNALDKEVNAFTGSTRNERAYKLLDEQALKIMIRCDELVDVSADIKEKRKEMIRNVQKVIDKLESKVPATPATQQNSNPMELAATTTNESSINTTNNEENIAKESSPSSNPLEGNTSASTTTEQSIST